MEIQYYIGLRTPNLVDTGEIVQMIQNQNSIPTYTGRYVLLSELTPTEQLWSRYHDTRGTSNTSANSGTHDTSATRPVNSWLVNI